MGHGGKTNPRKTAASQKAAEGRLLPAETSGDLCTRTSKIGGFSWRNEFLCSFQMLIRHDKELEQMKRMNVRKEEEVLKRQTLEKRALPKRIRSEMKAREMMFRESMRINMANNQDPELERNRFKKVIFKFFVCYSVFLVG